MIALLTHPITIGLGFIGTFVGGFFTGGGVSGLGSIIKWGTIATILYLTAKHTDII